MGKKSQPKVQYLLNDVQSRAKLYKAHQAQLTITTTFWEKSSSSTSKWAYLSLSFPQSSQWADVSLISCSAHLKFHYYVEGVFACFFFLTKRGQSSTPDLTMSYVRMWAFIKLRYPFGYLGLFFKARRNELLYNSGTDFWLAINKFCLHISALLPSVQRLTMTTYIFDFANLDVCNQKKLLHHCVLV